MCAMKGINPQKADLTFICHDISQATSLTRQLDKNVYKMMKAYTPGPITFILPAGRQSSHFFKNRKRTIGIRIPDDNILQALISSFGKPILSTSLLVDSDEEITKMWQLQKYLPSGVSLMIDHGRKLGTPSTVVKYENNAFEIIREGAIDFNF